MLSFIAAARESNIDLHLECERQFLNLAHAFDRVHYARYSSFQHIFLSDMKMKESDAYKDLQNYTFTASQKGGSFDAVHGDYICERQNADTKSSGGPIKSGSGSQISTFNTWIRTRHINVSLNNELKKILGIKTEYVHKDLTKSGIKKHFHNVCKLKDSILLKYKYDFFADGPCRAITSGKEIEPNVISDLLTANDKGNKCFLDFVQQRLIDGTISIFQKITKNQLKTGIAKPLKKVKPIEVLKEDVQGFGVIAEQKVSLEEAFQYPITTLPLSIAESRYYLRGATSSSKSKNTDSIQSTHTPKMLFGYTMLVKL